MAIIGVLALQGDFAEHLAVLSHLGVQGREVRAPSHMEGIDGLIIPGGESTVISRLMDHWGLREPIIALAKSGTPLWGTCAGLILTARTIVDDPFQGLHLLDVDVQRNAYGRQVDSFETEVVIRGLGAAIPAVFIRAPLIRRVGPSVEVLGALLDGTPVAVKEGNLVGSSFHPELTPDTRFHEYFLSLAKERAGLTNAAAI